MNNMNIFFVFSLNFRETDSKKFTCTIIGQSVATIAELCGASF